MCPDFFLFGAKNKIQKKKVSSADARWFVLILSGTQPYQVFLDKTFSGE
jgi:hypothetical protein